MISEKWVAHLKWYKWHQGTEVTLINKVVNQEAFLGSLIADFLLQLTMKANEKGHKLLFPVW